MIVGIGVDLLHLPRLRSLLNRRDPLRLAGRICSTAEVEEWKSTTGGGRGEASERYLALRCAFSPLFPALPPKKRLIPLHSSRRWAAKEAAYKALYPGFRPIWKDLEVRKVDKKPFLTFSPAFKPRAEECAGSSLKSEDIKMHLSVTHDADLVVAYVVAEKLP